GENGIGGARPGPARCSTGGPDSVRTEPDLAAAAVERIAGTTAFARGASQERARESADRPSFNDRGAGAARRAPAAAGKGPAARFRVGCAARSAATIPNGRGYWTNGWQALLRPPI